MGRMKCHLCHEPLFAKPLLALKGMPRAAQYFPAENEFGRDKGIALNIYQCSACGLVQLNARPVPYFKEVITAATLSGKARLSRAEQMKEFAAAFGLQGKRILEIGSGKGDMLDVLHEAGMKATGLEASASSVKAARSAGRNMIHGYIGRLRPHGEDLFDAFVSYNYLEHLPEPGAVIRRIYDITSDDAVGLVTVPNLDYLLASRCFYEFVADHLSYFTQGTLSHAFERNGFEVLSCTVINEGNDIAVTVRKRKPQDLSAQWQDVECLMGKLRQIVADHRAKGQKVAVWGAGHRTLALLALSRVEGVAYVIDSAKFKQGKFIPSLHVKIFPPEHLHEDPVGLVLVMVPGLYPGEVLKTLEQMKVRADIAVLRDNKIEFV